MHGQKGQIAPQVCLTDMRRFALACEFQKTANPTQVGLLGPVGLVLQA
jgi:hypothetical protein